MKKMVALLLTVLLTASLLLPALAEDAAYDLDAANLMDKWVYIDSTAVMTPMGQIKEGETAAVYPCRICQGSQGQRRRHLHPHL